jgi:hypothetical protein
MMMKRWGNNNISADEFYQRTYNAMLEGEPLPNNNNVVGEADPAPSLPHVNERWVDHRDTGYLTKRDSVCK